MKVLRVRHAGQTFYGQLLLKENAVVCLDRAIGLTEPVPLSEVVVLPPLSPSKVGVRDGQLPQPAAANGARRPG